MSNSKVLSSVNKSKPVPRQWRNATQNIMEWQDLELKMQNRHPLQCIMPGNFTVTSESYESHSCKTSLEKLEPIYLREMEIPKVHAERYLICKVIGNPIAMLGVNILVQDLNGDVEEAMLFNFRYKLDDINWISRGSILVIKEPYLQYDPKNKSPAMIIHSPSDVIFVDPTDDKLLGKFGAKKWYESKSKDANYWREKANECFKNGKFDEALMLYNRGIRLNPDNAVLYLNKALTCLKIEAFYDAYEAATIGLEKGGDREKALYRMGQAAYGMREWQKAAKHFLELLKEFPGHAFASEQFQRVTSRLAEARYGKYDFKQMFVDSKNKKCKLDVADYVGPITVVNIPGKGRGIVATKDIKKGTLLAVTKAFSVGFDKDMPRHLFTLLGGSQGLPGHRLQVIDTIQVLRNNPQRAKEFYDLHDGEDTVEKEELPFGVIDAAKVDKICKINRFGSGGFVDNGKTREVTSEDNEDSHLYLFPSYFNHSCLANAHATFYSDVVAHHAKIDIKKGDEICIEYADPLTEYPIRKKRFKFWKFECQCQLCEVESKDDLCSKRARMYQEFEKFVETNSPKNAIVKGEEILKKIRESYEKPNQFKVTLIQMLKHLASIYHNSGDSAKAIEYMKEAFTLLKNDQLKCAFDIASMEFQLAICYTSVGNIDAAFEMMEKAFDSSFCTDLAHFQMLHPHHHTPAP